MLPVRIDAGEGMAAIGEVAVWAFEPSVRGECAQAATDDEALERYAARTGRTDLRVVERITGPAQVFRPDLLPATDGQVTTTLALLREHRAATVALLRLADAGGALDREDADVVQPAWMPWRTPRSIGFHIAEHACFKRLGLPFPAPVADVFDELRRAEAHTEAVLSDMRRDLVTTYRGETWTTVKALRRLAWHERLEQVFLRRRLRAAGLPA